MGEGGSMHWKVWGGVKKEKKLNLKKVGVHDPPPSSYGGAAPMEALNTNKLRLTDDI